MGITKEDTAEITKLASLAQGNDYLEYRTHITALLARLGREHRVEDTTIWHELGKRVLEPAFLHFVLHPFGYEGKILGPREKGDIRLTTGHVIDVKFQTSPFFNYNPEFTFTINFSDIRNYDDTMVFALWHVRVPGLVYAYHGTRAYTGRLIDSVCLPTLGRIKKVRDECELSTEPYLNRPEDEVNERQRYNFDIRLFRRFACYDDGWVKRDWEAPLREEAIRERDERLAWRRELNTPEPDE